MSDRELPQCDPEGFLFKYFQDRSGRTRTINKWHHYFDIYEQYFTPFRGRPITFLEIGVQNGGSLDMWRAFFGPDAKIVGIDVDPNCLRFDNADGGKTRVLIGSQSDKRFLRSVLDEVGPFDAVLDDGGHTARQQIVSFETLYPSLRMPGAYLVEDTHTSFWRSFMDHPRITVPGLRKKVTFLDYAYQRCRDLHDWTRTEKSYDRLGVPLRDRPAPLPASEFCKTTRSVQFFDSVVAFAKQRRPEPFHETR